MGSTTEDLIGFDMEIDDLVELMKQNLPDLEIFPEIIEINERFRQNEEQINTLHTRNLDCRRLVDDMFLDLKTPHQPEGEVLRISDDDDDVAVVQVKTPTKPASAADGSNNQADTPVSPTITGVSTTPPDNHYVTVNDSKVLKFNLSRKLRVLGMKLSGNWYKGTVTGVVDREKSIDQWKYKVAFDQKGSKILSGKEMALLKPTPRLMMVGSRVCAVYKGDAALKGSKTSYYGGIVVEPPTHRNKNRFLVFFEDGYAQYCSQNDVFKVIVQNEDVSKDINPDSQEFIKEYLEQYPERPMVRLATNQILKTEYNGKWWSTKVLQVDGSLVQMVFLDDNRSEWIYRGSTRLEPLYTERAKTEELRQSNATRSRHKTNHSSQKRKPIVEYTRRDEIDDDVTIVEKRRAVARKSTSSVPTDPANKAVNKLHYSSISSSQTNTKSSDAQTEFISVDESMETESMGQLKVDTSQWDPKSHSAYVVHNCSMTCLREMDDKLQYKGENPLLIPMKCGWERHIAKVRSVAPGRKQCANVFYKTPCGRRLRSKHETDRYLQITDSSLTIDQFTFDPMTHTHTEFFPVKTFCDIKDLTYNKENVPLPCVNGVDKQMPDFIKYSTERKPTKDVPMNLDQDFMVCCECTDNCRAWFRAMNIGLATNAFFNIPVLRDAKTNVWKDNSKCACIALTIEAYSAINGGKKDPKVGYNYRTLKQHVTSGIFECNPRCGCDNRCHNRVVQNGLERRLQVYRTEKRGWGLRCLNDIPAGGFVCYYAGEILTSMTANEDGKVFGDEYLAELDYIETAEQQKEGYESDVQEPSDSEDDMTAASSEGKSGGKSEEEEAQFGEDSCSDSDSTFSGPKNIGKKKPIEKRTLPNRNKSKLKSKKGDSVDTKGSKKSNDKNGKTSETSKDNSLPTAPTNKLSTTANWVNDLNLDVIVIDSDEEEAPANGSQANKPTANQSASNKNGADKKGRKTQIKDKTSLFKNLPDPKKKITPPKKKEAFKSVRSYFNDGDDVYVIDAKAYGNLGRYLNHSCSPNTFVQNVFVDTHDPRFPWVAFFANKYIRAGNELTWDYAYCVGSVPGKVLYCYCGSSQCRGRLL